MSRQQSKLIPIEEVGSAGALERSRRPARSTLAGGDGAQPDAPSTPDDYVGDSADRTGFAGLEAVDEVTMLAVPDLMAAYQQGMIDLEGVQAVQLAMIAHCELMGDRVAILDPPPGLNAQQVKEWRVDKAGYDSKYATLYWPWIKVFDPLSGAGAVRAAVAATWPASGRATTTPAACTRRRPTRSSAARSRSSSTSPRASTTCSTPTGINCIRAFPGRGIRVWGARTLSSDPAWRYLNVRRLFNYLEESILEGTQWVVFEPNDHDAVGARQAHHQRVPAAASGATARCSARRRTRRSSSSATRRPTRPRSSTPASSIVEIGIAPVKPAEFVVFRIAQFSGGAGRRVAAA